jgi:hypothetical protein
MEATLGLQALSIEQAVLKNSPKPQLSGSAALIHPGI